MEFAKRESAAAHIGLDMTPMIDVCFQLIIFFMLSLRLFQPEGDFNVNMPVAAPSAQMMSPDQLPVMKVRLRARADGELAAIQFGDRSLGKSQIEEVQRVVATLRGEQDAVKMGLLETRLVEACRAAFEPLRQEVRKMIGDKAGPGTAESTEVELDCDYNLKYLYVMNAVSAVSGFRAGGDVLPLAGKIKFSPPRKP